MKKGVVDFHVWTEIEEMGGNEMNTIWYRVVLEIHCVVFYCVCGVKGCHVAG